MVVITYPDPSPVEPCPCCHGATFLLTRLITRNGTAYGMCHIYCTPGHADRRISMAISLGEWWIDDPTYRRCFSITNLPVTEGGHFVITEPDAERWPDWKHLGRMLTPAQAELDPELDVLQEIVKQIAVEDPLIGPYLRGEPPA